MENDWQEKPVSISDGFSVFFVDYYLHTQLAWVPEKMPM